jgi:FkbM family methyltransferase
MLLQKIKTAAGLLVSPDGFRTFSTVVIKNLRRWRVRRCKGVPFVYRVADGQSFVCIPSSATSVHLYLTGAEYEEVEVNVCRAWLRAGDVCVDGGANVGQFAITLANAVGPMGTVIAVEPANETAHHLRKTLSMLELTQVFVEPVCLSDKEGRVDFQVATGNSSDVSASMRIHELLPESRTLQVSTSTVVTLATKHDASMKISLIKLDIEGAEPLALAGAKQFLEGAYCPLFLVEVHRAALAGFGFDWQNILRFFPTERFELFHVQRSRSDLTPEFRYGVLYPLPNPADHPWPWYSNLLAIPREGCYAARRNQIAKLLPT